VGGGLKPSSLIEVYAYGYVRKQKVSLNILSNKTSQIFPAKDL